MHYNDNEIRSCIISVQNNVPKAGRPFMIRTQFILDRHEGSQYFILKQNVISDKSLLYLSRTEEVWLIVMGMGSQ